MHKTHEGIKYREIKPGLWEIVWPSGLKATIEASSEEDLKTKLDHAIQLMS